MPGQRATRSGHDQKKSRIEDYLLGAVDLRTRLLTPVRALRGLIAGFYIVTAALFALTALIAIANFAWRQPMFDQYRTYGMLIGLPFPDNVLAPDNAHRPIFPNLIRVAEIHWFHADQILQISFGTGLIILTTGLMAICAWRERGLSLVSRAAAVMSAILGVLWLANARMLMHGNESTHAYLVTSCVMLAALCVYKASASSPLRWLVLACAFCTIATFSFGPGIATFAAMITLGFLLRLSWKLLLVPISALLLCLVIYVWILPENDGVRGSLDFSPVETLTYSAQWLSSPWINGWLGMADPAFPDIPRDALFLSHSLLPSTANAIVNSTGLNWHQLAAIIGLLGTVTFALRALLLYRRQHTIGRLEALATGVALFSLASAAVIGIGRLDYLRVYPNQVFADRYLIWPSLFWACFAILLLVDAARARTAVPRNALLVFLALLPIVLVATHRPTAIWSSILYRRAQQTAAALRSNVFDVDRFDGNGSVEQANDLKTIALLRSRHLAMFADPMWERVGSKWTGNIVNASSHAATTNPVVPFTDTQSHKLAARFDGTVTKGFSDMRKGGQLAVLGDDSTLVGLAEFSFFNPGEQALSLSIHKMIGFDGYIANYDPAKKYRLVFLDGSQASVLSDLSSQAPAAGRN